MHVVFHQTVSSLLCFSSISSTSKLCVQDSPQCFSIEDKGTAKYFADVPNNCPRKISSPGTASKAL